MLSVELPAAEKNKAMQSQSTRTVWFKYKRFIDAPKQRLHILYIWSYIHKRLIKLDGTL